MTGVQTCALPISAVAISHGAPAPSPASVRQVTATLEAVADAVQAGQTPPPVELPSDEALLPVTEAVRPVLSLIAGPKQSASQGAEPVP